MSQEEELSIRDMSPTTVAMVAEKAKELQKRVGELEETALKYVVLCSASARVAGTIEGMLDAYRHDAVRMAPPVARKLGEMVELLNEALGKRD